MTRPSAAHGPAVHPARRQQLQGRTRRNLGAVKTRAGPPPCPDVANTGGDRRRSRAVFELAVLSGTADAVQPPPSQAGGALICVSAFVTRARYFGWARPPTPPSACARARCGASAAGAMRLQLPSAAPSRSGSSIRASSQTLLRAAASIVAFTGLRSQGPPVRLPRGTADRGQSAGALREHNECSGGLGSAWAARARLRTPGSHFIGAPTRTAGGRGPSATSPPPSRLRAGTAPLFHVKQHPLARTRRGQIATVATQIPRLRRHTRHTDARWTPYSTSLARYLVAVVSGPSRAPARSSERMRGSSFAACWARPQRMHPREMNTATRG
ncbi:hypothetical protein SAMN06265355_102593 [Actinomadura mexicana]|uniref:Uncharacterized protein n=1 Tax=Actinomadura mexicana TaxID=134959 RepID=A0A238W0E4_9ACTN|nr:hypothetical protein SAMN06265355_102593 [Actinomadura mexicana]